MLSLLQPITSPRKHVWASNYVSNSFKRTSRLRRAASPVPVANSSPIITELPQQFSELKSNGLLLIDKPRGWDMLDVIEAVKQAGGVKPLAHGGRLDISATGLVLVTSGAANKRAPSFMQLPKTFEGSFKLGASTDTYDAEGSVWEQVPWRHVTDADLQAVASEVTGRVSLLPPPVLANKLGKQMITRAAVGASTTQFESLVPAETTIHELRLWRGTPMPPPPAHDNGTHSVKNTSLIRTSLSLAGPQTPSSSSPTSSASASVAPSSSSSSAASTLHAPPPSRIVHFTLSTGTGRAMVRSLIHELGLRLGTRAHLIQLRRTAVGPYRVGDAWVLEALLPLLRRCRKQEEARNRRPAAASGPGGYKIVWPERGGARGQGRSRGGSGGGGGSGSQGGAASTSASASSGSGNRNEWWPPRQ